MAFTFWQQALDERVNAGLLRSKNTFDYVHADMLGHGQRHFLNFSSNDYLGLSQHPDVLQAYANGLAEWGAGATASPVVVGHQRASQALLDALCEHFGFADGLLFSSGFAANQALVKTMPEASAMVVDKLMHASFIEAAVDSSAQFVRFRHNDHSHLLARLNAVDVACPTLLVSEGVFSMDGDTANLSSLQQVQQQSRQAGRETLLFLDDAHGVGVLGQRGLGLTDGQPNAVDVLLVTFGKAFGLHGAALLSSAAHIDYLRNFSRHYVYSTAMSPATCTAVLQSLQLIMAGELRQQLQQNIGYFKRRMASLGLAEPIRLLPSDSAIHPLVVGSNDRVMSASQALKKLGIWITPIRYPTVPKGQDRLRITLSARHRERDIDALIDALELVLNAPSVTP